MSKRPYYPNFEAEAARCGISEQDLAKTIGVSTRALHNKRNGIRPFTWPEVDAIQKQFFPDKSKDYLFSTETA